MSTNVYTIFYYTTWHKSNFMLHIIPILFTSFDQEKPAQQSKYCYLVQYTFISFPLSWQYFLSFFFPFFSHICSSTLQVNCIETSVYTYTVQWHVQWTVALLGKIWKLHLYHIKVIQKFFWCLPLHSVLYGYLVFMSLYSICV